MCPVVTESEYDRSILPGYFGQDERDLVDAAVKVGWTLHVRANAAALIAPAPWQHKKLHLGRRNTIPIKRMRAEVIKFGDPDKIAAIAKPRPKTQPPPPVITPSDPSTIPPQERHGAEEEVPMTTTATARRTARPTKVTMPATNAATVPGTQITTTWEQVTPEMAEQMLTTNTNNRKIHAAHVQRLAKDMAADRYQITHQGVAVSSDNVLLDGQHRLLAIIESQTTQTLLVTRGLPPLAQTTMDGGRKRMVQDFLGGSQVAMRQGAARYLIAVRNAGPVITGISLSAAMRDLTTSEILEETTPEDFEALQDLAGVAGQAARNVAIMGPSPLLASTVLLIKDYDAAHEYLDGYATMTGLPEGDPRAALMKIRGQAGHRVHQYVSFGFALRATEAYVQGKEVRMLRSIPAAATIIDLSAINPIS